MNTPSRDITDMAASTTQTSQSSQIYRANDHVPEFPLPEVNALPREKMDPEMEKLYKMREVHQVKECLDVPEANSVDYVTRPRPG